MRPAEWGFAVQDALRLINGETVFSGRCRVAGIRAFVWTGQPQRRTRLGHRMARHLATAPPPLCAQAGPARPCGFCSGPAGAEGGGAAPRTLFPKSWSRTGCGSEGPRRSAPRGCRAHRPTRREGQGPEGRVKDERETANAASGRRAKGASCRRGARLGRSGDDLQEQREERAKGEGPTCHSLRFQDLGARGTACVRDQSGLAVLSHAVSIPSVRLLVCSTNCKHNPPSSWAREAPGSGTPITRYFPGLPPRPGKHFPPDFQVVPDLPVWPRPHAG